MAEFVQQSVEEMLPELEQMQRLGLFTAGETKKILSKRRRREYALRKTVREKKDYVKYIEYELHVLALVKQRRKALKTTEKRKEIDISIVHRIHSLYKLACMRFPTDTSLWLNHIEFCKSRNEMATVGQLFTNLLKINSHRPGLWIMAAQWEMETRLSMENARSILQRALRFNPDDKPLWIEYFRMELLNAEKLRKRTEVLGLADESNPEGMSAVHNAEVARIVYRQAVEKFPEVEFCASFLPVCMLFPFAETIVDDIFSELGSRFADQELAVAVVAKRPLYEIQKLHQQHGSHISEKTQEFIQDMFHLFDEAIQRAPTERMWDLYLETCLEVIRKPMDDQLVAEAIEHTQKVFHRAAEFNKLSERMASEWLQLLQATGRVQSAVEASATVVDQHTTSAALWVRRLRILVLTEAETALIVSDINRALQALYRVDEAVIVWKLVLEWCIHASPDNITEYLERGLQSKSKVVCVYIKQFFIDWAAIHSEIRAVRKLYKRLMSMPPISVEIFHRYLAAELSQAKPKMKKVRKAYDAVVLLYGSSDIDLWMKYIELEMYGGGGKPELVGPLHWKASKNLQSNLLDEFNERYTFLITSQQDV